MNKKTCVLGSVVALSALVGCVPGEDGEDIDDAELGTVSADLGTNLLVNGSFTTSMSGWTETVTGGDGHGGSGWDAPFDGDLLTSIAPGCHSQDFCVGNYQNYWAQPVQLTAGSSRTLSFGYLSLHGTFSFADLSVMLIKPSGASVTLFSASDTNGAMLVQNLKLNPHLTETGSYELLLISDIGNDLGVYAEGRFDEVGIF